MVDVAKAVVQKVIAKVRKQTLWKKEYELSEEIVWILYYQAIIWICSIFFPYLTAVVPFMLYIMFKYNYFSLRKFKERPNRSSNASVRVAYCFIHSLGHWLLHNDIPKRDDLCGGRTHLPDDECETGTRQMGIGKQKIIVRMYRMLIINVDPLRMAKQGRTAWRQ